MQDRKKEAHKNSRCRLILDWRRWKMEERKMQDCLLTSALLVPHFPVSHLPLSDIWEILVLHFPELHFWRTHYYLQFVFSRHIRVTYTQEPCTRNLHKFLASKILCKFMQVYCTRNLHNRHGWQYPMLLENTATLCWTKPTAEINLKRPVHLGNGSEQNPNKHHIIFKMFVHVALNPYQAPVRELRTD